MTSSTKGGGIHLNHSLKGVSLVILITFGRMGTVQFARFQWKNIMIFDQEQSSRICQLWRPWFQATQVQFFKQFPLPLSYGQPRVFEEREVPPSPPAIWSLLAALTLQLPPQLRPLEFSSWEFGGRLCCSSPLQWHFWCLSSVLYYTFCMVSPWGRGPSSTHRAWVIKLILSLT